jgi:hypothetical protein
MAIAKKTATKVVPVKAAAKTAPVKTAAKKAVAKSVPVKTAAPKTVAKTPTHAEISERAHSYWQERGHHHGSHHDDWLRAEKELSGK